MEKSTIWIEENNKPFDLKLFHAVAQITRPREEALGEDCPTFIKKAICDIAKKLSLNVLKTEGYEFSPQGYTAFAILSESHMSIHTWPEKKLIAFDLFCCREIGLEDVEGALSSTLMAKESETVIKVIDRNIYA